MRRILVTGIVILAGMLRPLAALAQDDSAASAFMKCARIAGDAQRLLCYDRLATELIELGISTRGGLPDAQAAAPTTGMEPAAPTTAAEAVSPPTGAVEPRSAMPDRPALADPVAQTPPAPPPTPASAAHAAQTAPAAAQSGTVAAAPASQPDVAGTDQPASGEDDFGIESMEGSIAKDVDRIESRYAGPFEGWDGDTIFELENGQVWQQSQSGRLVYRAENPKIVIKRGMLGGYYLSVDDVNRRVRVKRIK
jgi:hypothetical protein